MVSLYGCSDDTIGTRNAAPEASILVPEDGAQLLEGSPQTFTGVVSDELAEPGQLLVSLPVMALFYALQKHLVGGLTAGAVKG